MNLKIWLGSIPMKISTNLEKVISIQHHSQNVKMQIVHQNLFYWKSSLFEEVFHEDEDEITRSREIN